MESGFYKRLNKKKRATLAHNKPMPAVETSCLQRLADLEQLGLDMVGELTHEFLLPPLSKEVTDRAVTRLNKRSLLSASNA